MASYIFSEWSDFLSNPVSPFQEPFLFELDKSLHAAGIEINSLQAENSSGQIEISLIPKHNIQTADETFIFKETVSNSNIYESVSLRNEIYLGLHMPKMKLMSGPPMD